MTRHPDGHDGPNQGSAGDVIRVAGEEDRCTASSTRRTRRTNGGQPVTALIDSPERQETIPSAILIPLVFVCDVFRQSHLTEC